MFEKILLLFFGFIILRYTWKIHKEVGGVNMLERLVGPVLMLGVFTRIILDFLFNSGIFLIVFVVIFYSIVVRKIKKNSGFKKKFNMESFGNSILIAMGEKNNFNKFINKK